MNPPGARDDSLFMRKPGTQERGLEWACPELVDTLKVEKDVPMAKRIKHHTAEFKSQAVRMARASSEPIAQIAKELGVSPSILYAWLKKSDPESQPIPENESELARVKRELELVRMERDFLKKAAAFFAKNQQ